LALSFAKKFRTLLLASGLFIVFSMQANAQDDWKSLTTIDGVEISYQKSECDYAEVYLIKAVNNSGQSVSFNLSYELRMDDNNSAKGELGNLELAASAELVSTCEGGLMINIFDHFTELGKEYTIQITKSE
jgi:hypothetical protein